jgi:glycosyltransferase involved in cell wall biosynthesis
VGSDPWSEPWGGQITFAKHLVRSFGSRLAVVSTCTVELPEGIWVDRLFEGIPIRYFNIGHFLPPNKRRPLIPARISVYWMLKKHIRTVFETGIHNIILDDPELLFPASTLPWDHVCYCFAGVNNPVSNSRYPFLRWLGGAYQRRMTRVLTRVNPSAIIAAADDAAIAEFKDRAGPPLSSYTIHSFPTRVDTSLFFPEPKDAARNMLGLPAEGPILTVTGRLCWIKGWSFLLDVLRILSETLSGVRLVFVGDGEDRGPLIEKARVLGIEDRVRVTGFVPPDTVRHYINAADVCLVGSFREGWSLAMLETLACGKPLVSTDVSGARAMVRQGINGFVVAREPDPFSSAVVSALELKDCQAASLEIARRFSVDTLARDLGVIWPPLAEN